MRATDIGPSMLLGLRMAASVPVGAGSLKDRHVARYLWLIPVRDLFGFAVWLCGAFGHRVLWPGRRLRITSGGRICEEN
jgi:ceramide glucosyltransferase